MGIPDLLECKGPRITFGECSQNGAASENRREKPSDLDAIYSDE
jgi:hypothetical protein